MKKDGVCRPFFRCRDDVHIVSTGGKSPAYDIRNLCIFAP